MTQSNNSLDAWLDLLPAEPREGASARVAARVAAGVRASERRPAWRWPVGIAAAAAVVAAVWFMNTPSSGGTPIAPPSNDVQALAELSDTLSVIADVQADFFGTD